MFLDKSISFNKLLFNLKSVSSVFLEMSILVRLQLSIAKKVKSVLYERLI